MAGATKDQDTKGFITMQFRKEYFLRAFVSLWQNVRTSILSPRKTN